MLASSTCRPRSSRREFGVVLSRGSEVVHRVQRTIRLEPLREAAGAPPLVTFLESIEIRPGKYTLTAVLSDPATLAPRSVLVESELPEVPRGGQPFLVGPFLGRRAGTGLVVRSPGAERRTAPGDAIGGEGSFQPLLAGRLEGPSDFVAITQVCVVDARRRVDPAVVSRILRSASGAVIGQLGPVAVTLDGAGEVRCQSLVDVLPARAFGAGGDFLFEAALVPGAGGAGTHEAARFSVAPRYDE